MFFKKQFYCKEIRTGKNNILYLPPPPPIFVTISSIFILNWKTKFPFDSISHQPRSPFFSISYTTNLLAKIFSVFIYLKMPLFHPMCFRRILLLKIEFWIDCFFSTLKKSSNVLDPWLQIRNKSSAALFPCMECVFSS